jgi:tetratricopeptide (TPR) repeat protein
MEQLNILSTKIENIDGEIFKKRYLLKLGKIHLSYYEFKEAMPYYEKIVFSPSNLLVPFIYYIAVALYTRCLLKLGKIDDAINNFKRIPEDILKESSGRLEYILIEVHYLLLSHQKDKVKELSEVKALFKEKISNGPNSASKFLGQSIFIEGLIANGQLAEGRAMINDLLTRFPLNTPFPDFGHYAEAERAKKYLLKL